MQPYQASKYKKNPHKNEEGKTQWETPLEEDRSEIHNVAGRQPPKSKIWKTNEA